MIQFPMNETVAALIQHESFPDDCELRWADWMEATVDDRVRLVKGLVSMIAWALTQDLEKEVLTLCEQVFGELPGSEIYASGLSAIVAMGRDNESALGDHLIDLWRLTGPAFELFMRET